MLLEFNVVPWFYATAFFYIVFVANCSVQWFCRFTDFTVLEVIRWVVMSLELNLGH